MSSLERNGDYTLIFRADKELPTVEQQRAGQNAVSQCAGKTPALEHRDAEHGTDERRVP